MSKKVQFSFTTPYHAYRTNKVLGYLSISGQAKDLGLCPDDEEAEDFYSFDITGITFKDAAGINHDLSSLWHMEQILDDSLTDCIVNDTVAHMSCVFSEATTTEHIGIGSHEDTAQDRNSSILK